MNREMDHRMDDETARMLGDAAQRWAAGRYALAQRKPLLELPGAFSTELWREQAEMGWLALRLPEGEGGLDADAMATGALMEVVGSHLLMEPILASAIVATGLLMRVASPAQRAVLAQPLASGSLKLAFTGMPSACVWRDGALHGKASAVLHGDLADQLLVTARDALDGRTVLLLVDAQEPGVLRQCYRLVDGRGAANLEFVGAAGEALTAGPAADAAIETALQEASAAQCAEALGIIRALVTATCGYLKLRKQFGRPIGGNQVLQHRVVEMFVLQEEAAALTARALQALAWPERERAQAVSAAKAYIARVARQVANEAVQLHGGVGITDELAVSHHFRRLMVNAASFGNRDEQFACYLSRVREEQGEPLR